MIYMCESMKKKLAKYIQVLKFNFDFGKVLKNIILMIDCKFKTLFDAHLNSKKYIKTAYLYQILYVFRL